MNGTLVTIPGVNPAEITLFTIPRVSPAEIKLIAIRGISSYRLQSHIQPLLSSFFRKEKKAMPRSSSS
jgi:hypothetical protein